MPFTLWPIWLQPAPAGFQVAELEEHMHMRLRVEYNWIEKVDFIDPKLENYTVAAHKKTKIMY